MSVPVNDSLFGIGDHFGIGGDFSDSQRCISRSNEQGHDVSPFCSGLYALNINERTTIHEVLLYFAIGSRAGRQGCSNDCKRIKQFHMSVAGLVGGVENFHSTGQRALINLAAIGFVVMHASGGDT